MSITALVPANLGFLPAAPGVHVIPFDPFRPLPDEHHGADALVVFETPFPILQSYAHDLTRVRWVQSLGAGVDAMFSAGFRPGTAIASGRGLHDRPVAEHTIALLLAAARHLPQAVRAQIGHRWASELGGRQPFPDTERFSSLIDAHIAIWGHGSIGRHLAGMLHALGARTTGITRRGGEDGTVGIEQLPQVLANSDALVLLLPARPENERIVDAAVLRMLPHRAWVVNVGRGAVLDEEALAHALQRGELGGAALDVTTQEPLPVDSPLWDLPNVLLTPHAAGGRPLGAQALIENNLRAWAEGTPIRNAAGTTE
ncbi:phosphoglycerate dehydrogenase [Herbiconiux moechotypicola]|uniref:Phosphoglycerate dehydrogenase n=2 Tax=Herbiconiux moechotypicola TaxID=637393 RepID=A0ABN3E737_9MICO